MRLTMKKLAKLRHMTLPADIADEVNAVVHQAETDFANLVSIVAMSAASAVSSTRLSTVYIYYPAVSAGGVYDTDEAPWWRFDS